MSDTPEELDEDYEEERPHRLLTQLEAHRITHAKIRDQRARLPAGTRVSVRLRTSRLDRPQAEGGLLRHSFSCRYELSDQASVHFSAQDVELYDFENNRPDLTDQETNDGHQEDPGAAGA